MAMVSSPRVFVGNYEAELISLKELSIYGNLIYCALVSLPWVRCQCDGTDHPVKVIVAVSPCGIDSKGAQLFWDTGIERFCSADTDTDPDIDVNF